MAPNDDFRDVEITVVLTKACCKIPCHVWGGHAQPWRFQNEPNRSKNRDFRKFGSVSPSNGFEAQLKFIINGRCKLLLAMISEPLWNIWFQENCSFLADIFISLSALSMMMEAQNLRWAYLYWNRINPHFAFREKEYLAMEFHYWELEDQHSVQQNGLMTRKR